MDGARDAAANDVGSVCLRVAERRLEGSQTGRQAAVERINPTNPCPLVAVVENCSKARINQTIPKSTGQSRGTTCFPARPFFGLTGGLWTARGMSPGVDRRLAMIDRRQ